MVLRCIFSTSLKRWKHTSGKGIYIDLNALHPRTVLHTDDPTYPHMVVRYIYPNAVRNRMALWQQDMRNYYKRRVSWVHAPIKDQLEKEIM